MREGLCHQCGVHRNICVCDVCQPISGAPVIWALQHPSEVARAKGTLRIARACLPSLQVRVGETPEDFAEPAARAASAGMGLLFPTEGSQPLESSVLDPMMEWLVVDGTWRKASRIFHTNPWLQKLPRYHFEQPPESKYCIRRASRSDSLSTAEAITCLIGTLRPELDTSTLENAMRALVDRQLAAMPPAARSRY
ncbi:tRNA-uridine aminocarboxypropyltransferase [Marinobacter sp.]|uniref:tRNA-uridine aminocarboxypropyltransferase n=1 Tax=Marinobacter sp. TaxID=50741 RepID=UPI00384C3BE2